MTTELCKDLKTQWLEDGIIIARGIWDKQRIEKIANIAERILAQWKNCDPQTNKAPDPSSIVMRHLNHPAYYSQTPEDERLAMLEALASPNVLNICREIFDGEPTFRCSSLFFNPTRQEDHRDGDWHRDSQFVDLENEKERIELADFSTTNSVQMQIALVPSKDIEFVPGSHLRYDTQSEYHVRLADNKANNTQPLDGAINADLEPGDLVLFNPWGLHRGRYHVDKLRRNLMLTITKDEGKGKHPDQFNNQPWFLEKNYLDGISQEAATYYQRFIDTWQHTWSR